MTRRNGAIEWLKEHNLKFEFSKLALMDFTHKNKKIDCPPLILPNITIEPTSNTKYLGVCLDQHLNWNTRVVYTIKKGSSWCTQICQAVAPSWGPTPKNAQRMYISIAIP